MADLPTKEDDGLCLVPEDVAPDMSSNHKTSHSRGEVQEKLSKPSKPAVKETDGCQTGIDGVVYSVGDNAVNAPSDQTAKS